MLTAKTADVHALYEEAVQSPDEEVEFINDEYRRLHKRAPLTLREDFCGTGALAVEWVKSRKDRKALGVDLDASVMEWGKTHHLAKLPAKDQKRMRYLQADVRTRSRERFDVICAYNYSWWIFKQRADLLKYFRGVRAGLAKDGIFFLDIFGGSTSQQTSLEPRTYKGFKYVWEQASYNPVDGDFQAYIHFHFKDGSRIDRAFHYDWRLWQVSEARDVLKDAGFSWSELYWETTDRKGEPTGHFVPKRVVENEPSWNAYIIAG